ncbi:hypothetical protein RHSIM_Rhsim02G0020100 [Rhododendron simsii]|uniref:Peptidase A1 domain-containing protein n=1 Tax=Rhododendron simsii TaxID=118357 RepID=A0A834LVL3_RHOSS|nr:hypothetical protein RHSIM_Rhsim02G0020100 [Rhododendron simsii]
MASSFHFFSLIFFSLLFLSPSQAKSKNSFHPHALLLPVQKDPSTLLYTTQLNRRTPQVSENLTLDLGGQFLWVDCEKGYSSATTDRRARCSKNGCELFPENTVIRAATCGELGSDVVSIQSTDGTNPGRAVSVPHFLFVCGPTFLLKGLPSGVKGMAGLGRTKISLPSQFSSHFSFNKTFAICLTGSARGTGVVFFGPGPYHFLQNTDASTNLIYTPLLLNPTSTAAAYLKPEPSSDYFIGVTSIKINQKTVPNINASLLAIDREGNGGTKISTVTPYTVLQTSIYNAVRKFFKNQLSGIPTVHAVAPFGLCFNSTNIGSTRVGPSVPEIDLVLQNETVYWTIFGANSMVQVSDEVLCLAFVDGGVNPKTSIVIGGYQLEDNLLQFDLGASRLGFSSSLLFRQTTCANFNFTSKA